MGHCSILGCKSDNSKKQKNITYHRFPKDPALRIRWIRATGRYNWQPTIHSRICSRHFGHKWLRQGKHATFLNEGAYPKLFIQEPSEEEDVFISPESPTCNCKCHSEKNVENKIAVSIGTQTNPLYDIRNQNEESTLATDTQDTSAKKVIDYNSPEQRLIRKLIQKTELANERHKKIAMMRSKMWRLQKKNAYLTSVIADLKSQHSTKQAEGEELELMTSIHPINKVILKRVDGVPVGHNLLHQCRVEVRKRVIYTLANEEEENKS